VTDLAGLRDLVEQDLDDAGNAIWSTSDVDRAIKRALMQYSRVNPQRAVGTITLAADGREVSISTLTGLTRVVRVWHPYTASDPEDPPEWRRWELWGSTLTIVDGDKPASGEVVRVFYHKMQEIDDLDGAESTTLPLEDEEIIVQGASGYAALQKARSAVGEAGVSTETPEHWLRWSLSRLEAFFLALREVKARESRRIDKRVPMFGEGWQRSGMKEGI
jgi:hypothetical protein